MSIPARGVITLDTLRNLVESGAIDTVVNASADMQGRLIGKRVTAQFFLDSVVGHGAHFCTYLLGTDMELNTPQGFDLMNWDSGYGDYLQDAVWGTLRVVPWLEKTAIVLADVRDERTGELVRIAPRSILKEQVARAEAMGLVPKLASEFEYYLMKDSFDAAQKKGYRDLERFGWYSEDYQLFQSTKGEPVHRLFRNLMNEAGIPIEFSKGEAAPGQHEVNISYDDAMESADRAILFKHGAKEIAYQQGYAITFMAKPDQTWTGSSGHIHLSLWDKETNEPLFPEAGDPHGMSDTMRWFLGGLIECQREFALLIAQNVNSYKRFAAASWAPVNIVWARDNRTCGFRIVGSGKGLRIENRFPGGDMNPYLSYAMVIAAGLHGIEQRIEPGAEFIGNAYTTKGLPRVPRALYEAIEAFDQSDRARAIFGDDVVDHYVNAGRVEQQSYDMAVTDWERTRYFERG